MGKSPGPSELLLPPNQALPRAEHVAPLGQAEEKRKGQRGSEVGLWAVREHGCVGGYPPRLQRLLPGEYCAAGLRWVQAWGGRVGLSYLPRCGEGMVFLNQDSEPNSKLDYGLPASRVQKPPSPWPEPAFACASCSAQPAYAMLAARLREDTESPHFILPFRLDR